MGGWTNSESKVFTFDRINELKPAFDGHYGWIWITELNVIDPQSNRFRDIDEVTFEDGTIWMLVETVNAQ